MQSFGNSPQIVDNIDKLYAHLKGRSDGAIPRACWFDPSVGMFDTQLTPPMQIQMPAGRHRDLPDRARAAGDY